MFNRLVSYMVLAFIIGLPFPEKSCSAEDSTIILSLNECIDRALRENLNLKSYHLGIRSSELSEEQAKSIFDPAFSLSVERNDSVQPNYLDYIPVSSIESNVSQTSLTLNKKVSTGASLGFGFFNTLSESNVEKEKNYTSYLGFSLTQPLLRGFGKKINRSNIYLARMSSNSVSIDYENRAIDLVHSVSRAYWNLVFAREMLNVYKISVAQADSLLAFNEMGLDLGVKTQSDVLEARSVLMARHQDVLTQQNMIKKYEDELRRLIHLTDSENNWDSSLIPADKPQLNTVDTNIPDAISTALRLRPDYKNAMNTLEMNQHRQEISQNELLPDLDLNAGYRVNGSGSQYSDNLKDLTNTDAYGWNMGVSLSYPLWNRDARANSEKRHLDVRRSQLAVDELEEIIETDIRSSIRNMEVCREQLEVTRIAVEVNELKLKLEEERFRNNLTSSYYVLEFQRDLADARNRYNKAMIDYTLAITDYRRARGTLLTDNNISIIPIHNR